MLKRVLYTLLILQSISMNLANAQSMQQDVLQLHIELNYTNISIANLLDSIHIKYEVNFSYDPTSIKTDSLISVNKSNISLDLLLSSLLNNCNFQSIEKQVIISNKENPPIRKAKSNNIVIDGKLVCANSEKPLANVNISILGRPLGTISNLDGEFKLVVPDSLKNESVVISSISYAQKRFLVPQSDSTIYLLLKNKHIEIKEVKIKNISAEEIVAQCFDNIENNYADNNQILSAFFREKIKQDGQYIDVAEAILKIDKSKYTYHTDKERVQFIKGRKVNSEADISIARLKLAGGPVVFAQLDIVKHQDFFNTPDNNTHYTYKHIGYDIEHEKLVYKIAFKPIITEDNLYYEGEFNIDTESYALSSVIFRMTKRSLKNSAEYLIKQHAKKIKSNPFFTEYRISYRNINNRWLLSSVQGEIKIRMSDKRNKQVSVYHAVAELLITDAEYNTLSLKNADTFKTHYILAEKIKETDIDFWKDYNIITPEEELENVFKKPVEIKLIPDIKKPDFEPGF